MSRRVLSVIHYPIFGGPHNSNARIAPALARAGWELTVLIPDEPGNAHGRLIELGVDVMQRPLHRLRKSPNPAVQMRQLPYLWEDVKTIRRLIRHGAFEVVLINGLLNPQAAFAARAEGVATVWQLLDTRSPAPVRYAGMQLVTRLSDSLMSTGIETARVHPGATGFGERLIPFFPPVDCRSFQPDPSVRTTVRAEWGFGEDDWVLGSVGNINPQKGIENLIEALAIVRQQAVHARLLLIGSEYDTHRDYSRSLRAQVQRHGLVEGKDVVFAGARGDVARQLQGFDLFVMGSVPHSEGVPTAILEAMACGVPAVATDVGGVKEAIETGVTGYVVPPQQPDALAGAALRILHTPALRQTMAVAARSQAVRRFDVEACAASHIKAFEAAVAHRGGKHAQKEMEAPRAA